MVSQGVLRQLQAEGWYLKTEALDLLAQELSAGDDDDPDTGITPAAAEPSHAELRAALLDCDYRKLGLGCLPDDVNRAHSSSIKGPLVLQVMSVTDVSKPSYGSGSGPNRLLLLKLSDGRISCKAMEHKHCGNFDDKLLPGTKVVLQQASVKLGVVLLEPKSLHVLGGRVDSLAEAYEAQRKYGGTHRPGLAAASGSAAGPGVGPAAPGEAAAARLTSGATASAAMTADDGASAPRFKPFIVGRDDSRRSAAAAGSGSSRGRGAAAAASAAAVRPGTAVAAGTSAAIAAAAVGAVAKPPDEKQVQRSVDVAPAQLLNAQTAKQQTAAHARLLEKLERGQAAAAEGRGRGRGGFRGRRGRRAHHDSDDEGGGGMTLEEYEAKQKGAKVTLDLGKPKATGSSSGAQTAEDEQIRRDEELARQLQAQMDFDLYPQDRQQQYLGNRQQLPGYRQDGYRGRGRAGPTGRGTQIPLEYEQYSHHHQQQHQAPVGVDYTDTMFDSFDYNAGRGRGNFGRAGGRHSDTGRGPSRGRWGSGAARGRDAGSGYGRGRGRGRH